MSTTSKMKWARFWIAIVGLIAGLLIWVNQTVRSTQLSYQIQKIEERIRREKDQEVELTMQRDSLLSLDRVEVLAKKKLGLIVPGEKDIIVLEVPGGET